MTFQLYRNDPRDPPRRPISFDDLDNKAFWCRHGERQELAFVNVMRKIESPYTVQIHPEKERNPYHPDLLCVDERTGRAVVGEVKIKNSPLFYASKKYSVPSQYALTMDLKDSFNYEWHLRRGTDILIFIWVNWEAHEMETRRNLYRVNRMKGVWSVPFSRLRRFERETPPPIHWYKERFRQPPATDSAEHWSQMLSDFDGRLVQGDGRVKNISSNGFIERDGRMLPAGHSSCSYVFNLKDSTLFDELIFWESR